jgi:hypothetical protein
MPLPMFLTTLPLREALPSPRCQRQAAADEIRHDRRGCDVDAAIEVWMRLLRMLALALPRAQAQTQVPVRALAEVAAPVSTAGALQLQLHHSRPEPRPPQRDRYRRTWAARAQAPWLLPW